VTFTGHITPSDFTVARVLADRLMASCEPNQHWDELDELTPAQCVALDSIAFECQTCNHWFPAAAKGREERGGWLCRECE